MSDFEGSTLALQHYYDIVEVSKRLPLMTLYRANEQPFGNKMSVWMATEPGSKPFPEHIRERLESEMLKNRAINTPYTPRILDFGSGDGHGFVVTDDIHGDSLSNWLKANGPLNEWQLLRLAEQLTDIVHEAHAAGLTFLCLTSQNIFISDEARFTLITAPLGIGLHRQELLCLDEVPIVPNLVRHIPAWEFTNQEMRSPSVTFAASASFEAIDTTDEDEHDATPSAETQQDPSESIQDLDLEFNNSKPNIHSDSTSTFFLKDLTPEGFDADVYAVAAILYEAICGRHPYFSDLGEVCEAVFTMTHSEAKPLVSPLELSPNICHAVTTLLKEPKSDALPALLSTIAQEITPESREKAKQAEKTYLTAPTFEAPKLAVQKQSFTIPHPRILATIALVIVVALTATITHHFSSRRNPVDLFALPELLPPVAEGVDLVITLPNNYSDVNIYLTNLSDGSLMRLGKLPLIYRNQPLSSKIAFVLTDDRGKSTQLPVITNSEPGLQVVNPVL